jgi:signal transduction histidine kinase
MWRDDPWKAYSAAVLVTAGGYAIQAILWPYIPPSPTLIFFPAVFLAAWVGGAGPGVLSTVLSTVGIAWGFMPPVRSFSVDLASDALDLAIFAVVSVAISVLVSQLRAAKLHAERAHRAKNEVLEMVSHDLKAPLQAILLGADVIARRIEDGEGERALVTLGRVRQSALTSARLVREILDASHLGEVAPRPLAPIVGEVLGALGPLAEAKSIALAADVLTERPAPCDALRVQRVLANLVTNAIEFSPAGGHVQVRVQDEGPGAVRVSVHDNGPGIDPAELPHVFERRWSRGQTTGNGTGLGLFIAKAIVEAHGGALAAESRPGHGATFAFTLPIEPSARAPR